MKILNKNLDKHGNGYIELIPEENEDLWHLYNLIRVGDNVRCVTDRKHQRETSSGAVSVERIKTVLTIRVKKIDYDAEAGVLRVSGKNVCENKFVKIGQFHTVNLVVRKKMSISKKFWDEIDLSRVDLSSDISKKADLGAVVMEEGLAHVCLISAHMTIVKQKIEMSIPKKRFITSHQKGMEKFFNNILAALMKNFDFEIVKCVVIASPGFLKEQFRDHAVKMSHKPEYKIIAANMKTFVYVHSNSGTKQALKEVLSDQSVLQKLKDTKATIEVKSLNLFFKMLNDDPDKAIFGKKTCLKADEQKAIDTLMITDKLFKSVKVRERKEYVKLVESVKKSNGKVLIFSSAHVSGEQLDQISGVAAILRFPIPGIFESDSDDEG